LDPCWRPAPGLNAGDWRRVASSAMADRKHLRPLRGLVPETWWLISGVFLGPLRGLMPKTKVSSVECWQRADSAFRPLRGFIPLWGLIPETKGRCG
jgi:hypothetical protein